MKIRLQRGSVRFRLRQGEARALVESGAIVESVDLGPTAFVGAIELHDGPAAVTLEGGCLTARVPSLAARTWQSGAEVGLNYVLPGGTRLLIEKDWACLEPAVGETNADVFPRPPLSEPVRCGPAPR